MAERRMFTKKVTDDDNFMSLSSSAQALYLHLSMSADDDGFCNQVTAAMFKAHASVQDLQALLEKRYIYQFENGVIVIKHWRMANALRKDRYTQTSFKEELAKLELKDNGSYTLINKPVEEVPVEENQSPRQLAYKRSSLPYSFDYKIRQAFYGRPCPVCGAKMMSYAEDGIETSIHVPTIQHNLPISKGGEHELGNISVICKQCNITIQDKETGELNAKEVIEEWEKISGCRLVANCLPQVVADCPPQVSIGENSIEESSVGKVVVENKTEQPQPPTTFTPPTKEEIINYCKPLGLTFDIDRFYDFYSSNGWMVRGRKMRDWQAACRYWASTEYKKKGGDQNANMKTHDWDYDKIEDQASQLSEDWLEKIKRRAGMT